MEAEIRKRDAAHAAAELTVIQECVNHIGDRRGPVFVRVVIERLKLKVAYDPYLAAQRLCRRV